MLDLYNAQTAELNEEWAGHFEFGESEITNVNFPEPVGKDHTMAFEFTQKCNAKGLHHGTQKLGPTSPVNCAPGRRGAVVLHGHIKLGVADELDTFYQADRLVMYLQK